MTKQDDMVTSPATSDPGAPSLATEMAGTPADLSGFGRELFGAPPGPAHGYNEVTAASALDVIDNDDMMEHSYLDRLKTLLTKSKAAAGLDLIEADALLHAVLCLPSPPSPEAWLPLVLGDPEDATILLSEDELGEAIELLLRRYDELADGISGGTFLAEPLVEALALFEDEAAEEVAPDAEEPRNPFTMHVSPVEKPDAHQLPESPFGDAQGRQLSEEKWKTLEPDVDALYAESKKDGETWARSFISAFNIWIDLQTFMRGLDSDDMDAFVPLLMLVQNTLPVNEDSPDHGRQLTPAEHDLALTLLPESVSRIYQLMRKPAKRANRVSRNDPCPCGSGKKYKKCCLNRVEE